MNIYQYSSDPMYQHLTYQQCSLNSELTKDVSVNRNERFEPLISHNVTNINQDYNGQLRDHLEAVNVEKGKEKYKANVDTSNFSIEERLVAAVWVHERKRLKNSISQIRQDFQHRFGREPPAKNTLLVWERKLFSTGSVCDAPRPGRPINRKSRVDEVATSMRNSPALSLRARAIALRVPRTTLRAILQKDLSHPQSLSKDVGLCKNIGKQTKKRAKRQVDSAGDWQPPYT